MLRCANGVPATPEYDKSMLSSASEARALAMSGMEALRVGDALRARETFERITASAHADAFSFVGLAYACRSLRDQPATLAAVDKALALEPRNLRALLLKGDYLAESGDPRGASSFYSFAVQTAPPVNQLPPDLREDLARAQAVYQRYAGDFEAVLRDKLLETGLIDGRSGARFRQSLDILLGKKQIYFQQPHTYFFPGLPQIQFYDSDDFPWLGNVEAATADIRRELLEVLADASAFQPYIQGDPRRPRKEQDGLQDNPDWGAFYLWKDGEIMRENVARCPRTASVVADVPMPHVKNRSPSVLFSLLRPGAHIPPHTGLVNTRLICHLPLVVPPNCTFRVGNDVRVPVEGKAWLFDDTIEHEAWNRSDKTRVILLFETWRPELSEEERSLVSAMFDAIDAYSGQKPTWTI